MSFTIEVYINNFITYKLMSCKIKFDMYSFIFNLFIYISKRATFNEAHIQYFINPTIPVPS